MNEYASWYTEIHPYKVGVEVTRKIVSHLAVRVSVGSAIIVCDRPRSLMPAFKKRWSHILRLLENERAATNSSIIKAELKMFSKNLASTPFLIDNPDDRTTPAIWLLEPDDFNKVPQGVMTIYVMADTSMQQVLFWARQMEDESAVVIFRKAPLSDAIK